MDATFACITWGGFGGFNSAAYVPVPWSVWGMECMLEGKGGTNRENQHVSQLFYLVVTS